MKLTKALFALPLFFALFILFNTSISSCNKDNMVEHDTVTVVKHDTTVTVDSIYDITSGMVAYYNFNNGNLNDSSGYGNNLTNTSATATADRFGRAGNAYLFNGSSSYMQAASSQSLNPDNITLFAIVKLNAFYTGSCHVNQILGKGEPDNVNGFYCLRVSDFAASCSLPVDTTKEQVGGAYGDNNPLGSGAGALADSVRIKTGTWYSLAYTYDGITSRMYINGVLKSSAVKSVPFSDATFPLLIGKHGDPNFPYWFDGVIDEIRIYNRALPQVPLPS